MAFEFCQSGPVIGEWETSALDRPTSNCWLDARIGSRPSCQGCRNHSAAIAAGSSSRLGVGDAPGTFDEGTLLFNAAPLLEGEYSEVAAGAAAPSAMVLECLGPNDPPEDTTMPPLLTVSPGSDAPE